MWQYEIVLIFGVIISFWIGFYVASKYKKRIDNLLSKQSSEVKKE